ncbi:MAG: cytochrome c oxidase subunit [Solirubrobacteraceae bacterium]|jgi:cytochrome c oxidase subunit 2|nr:cytochrome c oxidase subunit [Solirubrobacteraceae bacterium]
MNRIPAALRRKPSLAALASVSLLAALALPGAAHAGLLAPESGGSPNADRISDLYWIVFAIALVVFAIVMGALGYSLIKFRARRGAVAAQIHGNTQLEIGWTVGAAVILVALAVATFVMLPGIRTPENSGAAGLKLASGTLLAASPTKELPPNGKSLNICVNGQQYIWRYTYQSDCRNNDFKSVFAYEEMVVPTDTTVTLDITGQDVIHSWWIPKLGGKFDAVPGYFNHTWFKIPGRLAGTTFTGQCAELCGRNHADMLARVRAVSPADFEQWLSDQKAAIAAADKAAQAQRKQYESTTP